MLEDEQVTTENIETSLTNELDSVEQAEVVKTEEKPVKVKLSKEEREAIKAQKLKAKAEADFKKRLNFYKKQNVSPLSWKLYPIMGFAEDEVIYGFFTRLFINSPELGTLSLEVYDVCTNTVTTGSDLSLWQLKKAVKLIKEFKEQGKTVVPITVYVPVKMVLGETIKKPFAKFIEKLDYETAKYLCFAFSSELLFANPEDVQREIRPLKEKGVTFALLSFGEEYYAPLRMKSLNIDYVYYAPDFSSRLLNGEQEAILMVKMAEQLGYKCVAQFWNGEEYEVPFGTGVGNYPADFKLVGKGYDLEDLLKSNG